MRSPIKRFGRRECLVVFLTKIASPNFYRGGGVTKCEIWPHFDTTRLQGRINYIVSVVPWEGVPAARVSRSTAKFLPRWFDVWTFQRRSETTRWRLKKVVIFLEGRGECVPGIPGENPGYAYEKTPFVLRWYGPPNCQSGSARLWAASVSKDIWNLEQILWKAMLAIRPTQIR